MTADIPSLLRELAPRVLGVLVRRFGGFDECEDAVQEALLAAAQQWPAEGVPANPTGWLVTVASRRWTEAWRSDLARSRRERIAALREPPAAAAAPAQDDTLTLLLLCCHPVLSPVSQVALTLRAVGGLTTAEIARGLLVPEKTVGQRISRAKQRLRGARFTLPPAGELADRMVAVRHVLYLIFNEGYTASSGPALHRVQLSAEAIRLTRQLHRQRPDDGETAGLLALMLLTDARRPARTDRDGALIPLAEQDRGRWNRDAIAEGTALVARALTTAEPGPFPLQAAIAAVHDEAATAAETDWPQILILYDLLHRVAPGPMVTLGRIVALSMVDGQRAGLRALDAVAGDPQLARHHRLHAIRAHLLDQLGDAAGARAAYELAARLTLSIPERAYLQRRAMHLRRRESSGMVDDVTFHGGVNIVRRRGDAVHRPASAASATIQRLLRHVRQQGFDGAPEPRGFDAEGNEVLSYLDGTVHAALPAGLRTRPLLAGVARTLRRLHDASASFPASADDRWLLPPRAPAEVICHGDVAPYNCVIRDRAVVGFIDFDTAHPGPRLWDVAYAVYRFAPLHAPTNPDSAGGPVEQAELAAHFCHAYGMAAGPDLLDTLVQRLVALLDFIRGRAAAGDAAFQRHVADGHPAWYEDDIAYLDAERATIVRTFAGYGR